MHGVVGGEVEEIAFADVETGKLGCQLLLEELGGSVLVGHDVSDLLPNVGDELLAEGQGGVVPFDGVLDAKIGLIYSYGANDAVEDGALEEEGFDTEALSLDARSFLEGAIADYNAMFGTTYDTSADRFGNYYKDLSMRLKNRELDMVVVVNMFLTGFDATTLNTLFVDKNLRSHGLIQPLFAYQPDPELGQDLRQHRQLPRPGARDERRHRPIRQQGRPRRCAAEAVRRLLQRLRRQGH